MVSKRDLGVSYLVTVGLVLSGVLSAGVLPIPTTVSGSTSLLAACMGVMVAGGFSLTGVGLARSTIDGERVWRVAAWSTLGLGIPTLFAVVALYWVPWLLVGVGWRSVLIVNIAAGGVVGVLAGSLLELRAEHERTRTLNQRNTVFLRLFRHDIRTSVNVVRGHLDLVAESADATPPIDSVETIDDQLDHIARLSDAASRLDDLESMTETHPVDLGGLVAERVDELRRVHDVTVETDLTRETHVRANELLASVVDNLLRNAVEHNDDAAPRVWVTVAPVEDAVELRVRDDGPGFSETELVVHSRAVETALRHSDGVGLWLVRWIVDAYDGTFEVGNCDGGGAVATVTLPATAPALDGEPSAWAGLAALIEEA